MTVVTKAIGEIYAEGRISGSFEEVYRHGYNLVLFNKGEELYSAVEATMTYEVQSLCRPLDAAPAADAAAFLQEVLNKWKQHVRAVDMTRDMLMFMDRTFVLTNSKAPIKELGLCLWRDNMARSDKIRPRLIQAVRRQRGGEDELVAGVNEMLTELGAEVMEIPCLFFRDGAGKLHAAGP
nr:unnamed protein product [Digitaria exilis]